MSSNALHYLPCLFSSQSSLADAPKHTHARTHTCVPPLCLPSTFSFRHLSYPWHAILYIGPRTFAHPLSSLIGSLYKGALVCACGNMWKAIKIGAIETIYSELAVERESATPICICRDSIAGSWESFIEEKRDDFRYVLIGRHWQGESRSGLTSSGIWYGWFREYIWLSLIGPKLERSWGWGGVHKIGKLAVTDQVLTILGWLVVWLPSN